MSNVTYMAALATVYKAALTKHLGPTGKDKFDCFIEGGSLLPSFKDLGDGVIAARFVYTCVFSFESLPAALIDPRILMAMTMCWLAENDTERERQKLDTPDITVDAYADDDSTSLSDMDIKIVFSEPIAMRVTDDEKGDITYRGKQWVIAPFIIHVAESGKVINRGS
ncbi:phage tail protein [Shewanella sp. D64]|uniref:phage tail protein n=1 Tax=unclassified Shewanella TaxID=196818 RepID=UPI0022BA4D8C|nr:MULTISPECIES: phage tail protein [unclassified Shewanella]MEC4728841.1 phage tail protein [Shewanella sp. D64]MEC4740715.1 phage tail protein [Shewanella sp. E94]WBJ95326.1 phage tail protein [Shewanella sp. MTB7]